MNDAARDTNISPIIIALMKSVIYRESDLRRWQALLDLQARVRDYAAVLGLDLTLDEAEGYAFFRQRVAEGGEEADELPRLVSRRQLSYPVSLLLALLRKRLAEFDAGSSDDRLILDRGQILDLVRLFLPDSTNEAKLFDRVDGSIEKIVELGFLRRLGGTDERYEVRRILKAFVDAQWLGEFSARLAEYRRHAGRLDDAAEAS
jgi:hypothetical protein